MCRQEAVSAGLVIAVVMIAGALSGPGNATVLGFALVVGLMAATIDIGLVRHLNQVPLPRRAPLVHPVARKDTR